jgi:hypothetical protein
LNKRIAWGTMLTVILVSMLALTISIRMASAVYDAVADLNNDGKVDGLDIAIVAQAFGTRTGMVRFNPEADIVPVGGDGQIDGRDLVKVAKSFGSSI